MDEEENQTTISTDCEDEYQECLIMIITFYRKDIPMTESTIACLQQQITSEQEAAQQGLYGLAIVASHRAITARMERAVQRFEALCAVGKEQEAQVLLFSDTFYEGGEEASCRPH